MNDLPKGWELARIDELGVEVRDSARPHSDLRYELYSVPCFPAGRPEIVTGDEIGSAKRVVKPGDVLLCKINPRINRVWKVGPETDGLAQIASTEYYVLRTIDSTLADYLMWYFRGPRFRDWIKLSVEGATGSHTRVKSPRIKERLVPIPPLSEQRRIVDAIEENVQRLLAAEASLHVAGLRENGLSQSIFSAANNPEWPEVALGDLLDDIEAGKSFKTPGRPAAVDEWGVVKVSAMTWGHFDESENKAVLDIDRVDPRYQIACGDLLLSRANTSELVGATVLVGDCRDRLLLSDKSMRLITKPKVDRQWLRYCLGSPALRAQMSAVATGTSDSMRNISQAKVKALRVRVPTPSVQRKVAAQISAQLELAARLGHELESATQKGFALRRSILEAAFCGQLVPQEPTDESASRLLDRIAAERASAQLSRRKKQAAL